jgi:hypothetical protein
MRVQPFSAGDLRRPERRVIALLRAFRAGDAALAALRSGLGEILGPVRAASCLDGTADLMALLDRHGWHRLTVLPETAEGWSEDELAVARFVMAATEQRREVALAEASFLVSPAALLPMLTAASRLGLPLLCEECRARVMGLGGEDAH